MLYLSTWNSDTKIKTSRLEEESQHLLSNGTSSLVTVGLTRYTYNSFKLPAGTKLAETWSLEQPRKQRRTLDRKQTSEDKDYTRD